MNIRKILGFLLASLLILFPASAEESSQDNAQDSMRDSAKDGALFKISGDITGMYTIGLEDDEQAVILNNPPFPPGIYDDQNNGKNGYYTRMNIYFLFTPVSYVEVYAKLMARVRPGSPYIPLQLEHAEADNFGVTIDNVYGRVDAIGGLGFDLPLSVFLKAGKYDTVPANFQRVSRYGAESVMTKLRTKNTYAVQIAADYRMQLFESLGFSFTANHKLNEAVTPLYDEDGSKGLHGTPSLEEKYDIPLHFALRMRNFATPLGPVSAEFIYAYNAEYIYSGNNFGFDAGWKIAVPGLDNLAIPFGVGVALYEKNIDPLAEAALDKTNQYYINALHENDYNTISFRRSLRIGAGLGARYTMRDIEAELNVGYSYSQIAHIYRDTLSLNALSADLRCTYLNKYFIGGGVYAGTLGEAEWKTNAGVDLTQENGYKRVFKPEENIGFEVYGGLRFGGSRFVLGYNCNKGLAMNNSIESIPEAQTVYRQKDTSMPDGLFENGGVFAKLVITW
jgi:hypothetical protein